MKNNKVKLVLIIIAIFAILVTCSTFAFATEDKTIFNIETDGYWKPGDSISHEFTVSNIWGQECYLDYLTFDNSYIRDVKTLKEYSVQDAIDSGIINDYKVIVSLSEGNEKLFEGSMKDLESKNIILDKKIFMKLDSVIKFNISISLDELATNEYQNKSYEYIIKPSAYKIIYSQGGNKDMLEGYYDEIGLIGSIGLFLKTGDWNSIVGFITIILLCGSFIIIIKSRKRKE